MSCITHHIEIRNTQCKYSPCLNFSHIPSWYNLQLKWTWLGLDFLHKIALHIEVRWINIVCKIIYTYKMSPLFFQGFLLEKKQHHKDPGAVKTNPGQSSGKISVRVFELPAQFGNRIHYTTWISTKLGFRKKWCMKFCLPKCMLETQHSCSDDGITLTDTLEYVIKGRNLN